MYLEKSTVLKWRPCCDPHDGVRAWCGVRVSRRVLKERSARTVEEQANAAAGRFTCSVDARKRGAKRPPKH